MLFHEVSPVEMHHTGAPSADAARGPVQEGRRACDAREVERKTAKFLC